ncbi:MAG TPA: ABC transporter substrate-binding protein [Stellaceae bacterium]|jgi:NitT/TauT family transport system substrate-binding protein|nr:ABC transporter substrate-binding protein [Stellaceae bacterium]
MRWARTIVALIGGATLTLASAPARAIDTITFGHVGAPSAIVWPIYIGLDQGFFDERNIKIDMIFTRSSAQVLQQLTAGALDMGDTSALDPVRGINEGAAVAILAIEATPGPFSLLAKPEIKSIKDLKGKTISVGQTTDIARIYFDRMLLANGLADSDVDALPTDSTAARLAALESKAVDAAMLSAPASFHAAADGFATLGLTADYVKDFPFGAIDIGRGWAASHQAVIQRFMAAYLKSVAWFYDDDNRDPAIRIMTEASNTSVADNTQSYDYYRKIGFFERSATVSRAALQSLVAVLQKTGEINGDLPAEKLVMPGVTQLGP